MSFELLSKIKVEKMPLWSKGLKIDEDLGVIFSWSQLKTCFNTLDNPEYCKIFGWYDIQEDKAEEEKRMRKGKLRKPGTLIYKYKSLTTYEDYITDIIMSLEFKYFITGTYFGHIFVWKAAQRRKLIHSFSGHTKTVTAM